MCAYYKRALGLFSLCQRSELTFVAAIDMDEHIFRNSYNLRCDDY